MKLKAALLYKLRFNLRSDLIFLAFFLLFGTAFPLMGVFISHTKVTVQSELLLPSVIFMIIAATIGIGLDFKLFIQCGLSRKNIFLASVFANFLSILGFNLILIGLEKLFHLLSISNFKLGFVGVSAYTDGKFWTTWLLLTVILFLANGLGFVAGMVLQRFDGAIRVLIGLGAFAIPLLLVILVQLLSASQKAQIITRLGKLVGVTSQGLQLVPLVLTVLTITLVLLVLVYLMNRHREIKRINA